jgi:hypothetical protein
MFFLIKILKVINFKMDFLYILKKKRIYKEKNSRFHLNIYDFIFRA